MTTWFTADLHFGHANIINYSGRPFADAIAMNQALIERWNASIHPDDTAWVLGDVALGRIDETLALVGELNGRKLLLAGNHDRCWAGHGRRAEGWTERYLASGFAEDSPPDHEFFLDFEPTGINDSQLISENVDLFAEDGSRIPVALVGGHLLPPGVFGDRTAGINSAGIVGGQSNGLPVLWIPNP